MSGRLRKGATTTEGDRIVNKLIFAGTVLAVLAGCAPFPYTETPLATNFETTRQLKLQAAHHWQVIAKETADDLLKSLAKGGVCFPGTNCPRLYVEPTNPRSAFGRAFYNQFVSRLVTGGQNVTTVPAEADITITLDAQTVRFSPNRSQYLGAGKFTMLTTGLWGLHEIHEQTLHDRPAPVLATVAVIADVLEYNMAEFAKGPTPQLELILTAAALKNKQYVARSTSVYYAADGDASLYCWKAEGCGEPDLGSAVGASASVCGVGGARCSLIPVVGDCGSTPCRVPAGGSK